MDDIKVQMSPQGPEISPELLLEAQRKARVLSDIACPVAEPVLVQVIYKNDSGNQKAAFHLQRPAHFDRLQTSVVDEVSFPVAPPDLGSWSPRNIARYVHKSGQYLYSKLEHPRRYDQPVLDTRATCSANFALLLAELIPACLQAKRVAGPDTKCIFQPFGGLEEQCHALLSLFGITPTIDHRRVQGPMIHLRGIIGLSLFELAWALDSPMVSFFPDTYSGFQFRPVAGCEKVFLARRDSRTLLNHKEVSQLLKARGYRTIFMEDHPAEEQLRIAATAKHVVAIHGAAMASLLVNRGLASVVEISPPHVFHQMFPLMLEAARYVTVIPEFDIRVAHVGWHLVHRYKSASFAIDPAQLEAALEAAEAGARPVDRKANQLMVAINDGSPPGHS